MKSREFLNFHNTVIGIQAKECTPFASTSPYGPYLFTSLILKTLFSVYLCSSRHNHIEIDSMLRSHLFLLSVCIRLFANQSDVGTDACQNEIHGSQRFHHVLENVYCVYGCWWNHNERHNLSILSIGTNIHWYKIGTKIYITAIWFSIAIEWRAYQTGLFACIFRLVHNGQRRFYWWVHQSHFLKRQQGRYSYFRSLSMRRHKGQMQRRSNRGNQRFLFKWWDHFRIFVHWDTILTLIRHM